MTTFEPTGGCISNGAARSAFMKDVVKRKDNKMDINSLTIGEAKQLAAMFGGVAATDDHPFNIGGKYFIRTVTHHHTGKLVRVTKTELVIKDAAWIADDGRLTDALKTGNFNEVEMFPTGSEVIIGRGSLIDAVEIPSIPTSQK